MVAERSAQYNVTRGVRLHHMEWLFSSAPPLYEGTDWFSDLRPNVPNRENNFVKRNELELGK